MKNWSNTPLKRIGVLLIAVGAMDIAAAIIILAFDMSSSSQLWDFILRIWAWDWNPEYERPFSGYSIRYGPMAIILGLLLSVWYHQTVERIYNWIRHGS